MAEGPPSILVIGGPTASGKSALAADAAARFGGVVANADSMQLYRDLPILTSWPDDELRARAPHRLYGVLDGAERCSAGRWRALAMAEIERIRGDGALPILVGGTGLYLRALLAGLAPVPPTPEPVRAAVRALYEREGSGGLHARLAARDPEAARRLEPGDSQRVMRAYEVIEATGRSLLSWQAEKHESFGGRAATLVLEPPRAELYDACNTRFEGMMAAGALDEAAGLKARGLDPGLPVMKAVGVRALHDYLSGVTSLERAIALGRQETRRYAKRQTTWFRTQMPGTARMPDRYRAEFETGISRPRGTPAIDRRGVKDYCPPSRHGCAASAPTRAGRPWFKGGPFALVRKGDRRDNGCRGSRPGRADRGRTGCPHSGRSRRRCRVRLSRRRGPADLRRHLQAERAAPHPGAARAGRRPRRRGLCAHHRQGRHGAGHLRPRRHQQRHRASPMRSWTASPSSA